jgi:hypothetical protein
VFGFGVAEDDGVTFSRKGGWEVEGTRDEAEGPSQPGVELVKAKNLSAWNRAERVRPLSRNDRISAA